VRDAEPSLRDVVPRALLSEPRTQIPSDAATEEEARIYDLGLRDVDDPDFHLRWSGHHAAAMLAALRHAHRVSGPIRQVEWGSYEVVLDGAAIRRLLGSVLDDEGWWRHPVEVVQHSGSTAAKNALLPAHRKGHVIQLGAALDLIEDGHSYSVVVDVY
jgi:hypothetical protein